MDRFTNLLLLQMWMSHWRLQTRMLRHPHPQAGCCGHPPPTMPKCPSSAVRARKHSDSSAASLHALGRRSAASVVSQLSATNASRSHGCWTSELELLAHLCWVRLLGAWAAHQPFQSRKEVCCWGPGRVLHQRHLHRQSLKKSWKRKQRTGSCPKGLDVEVKQMRGALFRPQNKR